MFKKTLAQPEAMEQLGAELYAACRALQVNGMIVYLLGDLGAGKTTFVRGFLQAMGHTGIVKSPTYTLVEPYTLQQHPIYHFDFYRLTDPYELELMGIRDYFQDDAFCFIEWPEKAPGIAKSDLTIRIEIMETTRSVIIESGSDRGKDALQRLK